jgi:hypothetical protein
LGFVTAFSLAVTGLAYYADHANGALGIIGLTLLYLVVGAIALLWVLWRCLTLRIHRSPFFIVAVIVLAALPWSLPYSYWVIDWGRFQKDRGYYEDAISMVGSSNVHAFDWGYNGIGPYGRQFFLIFNTGGEPHDFSGLDVCLGPQSAWRISGDFYSVTFYCG